MKATPTSKFYMLVTFTFILIVIFSFPFFDFTRSQYKKSLLQDTKAKNDKHIFQSSKNEISKGSINMDIDKYSNINKEKSTDSEVYEESNSVELSHNNVEPSYNNFEQQGIGPYADQINLINEESNCTEICATTLSVKAIAKGDFAQQVNQDSIEKQIAINRIVLFHKTKGIELKSKGNPPPTDVGAYILPDQ
ncbi:hypothetical protein [Agarilytica rhodophyticola]|uniref:hypothetical protein n=1 Tax=Agarilytica rhodophyticola TaxID=1737490 RepID=UPI000B34357C|nr:hypothetical protein [Agarilytica rhodophyticola]